MPRSTTCGRCLHPDYARLEGAITGRALYDGRLDPAAALALHRREPPSGSRQALRDAMVAVFGILLVLIALVAFGPALIAVVSQTVAEAFGCQVDLNRVIPCEIGGKDYGQTFYDLGFSIWYSYLRFPPAPCSLAWVAAAIIAFIVVRVRKSKSGSA